jgi:hypothetical protein
VRAAHHRGAPLYLGGSGGRGGGGGGAGGGGRSGTAYSALLAVRPDSMGLQAVAVIGTSLTSA